MRTASYFVVFLIGLSTAANTQKGPVYTPLPTVINAANAKSSLPTSIVSSIPSPQNNQPAMAEERESPAFRTQEQGQHAVGNQDASPTQSYMVYYYANPNAKASTYQQQGYNVKQPNQPGFFSSVSLKDWGMAIGSLAFIGVGTTLAYRNFAPVKSRALRELQDMKAEDAARMAKGVMRALEKVYELSSSK